ncbi:HAD family hydrolase [Sungkyunkwania multivorans]|uniref:HAD family hydrolase n=1 Tax=Sungkyunkwania multivorans TaxID=1173618 RepID=A0ABW3D1Q0_9FLAO
MSGYKCVIFDCDGVLVDSENIGNQVLVEMANELGADIDLEYAFKMYVGSHLYACMQDIECLIGKPVPMSFETEFRKRSFDAFDRYLLPVNGVEGVLTSMRLPFCVASSGPQNKIRLNLKNTGLLQYFDNNIYSCYDINKWKPEPDIFIHAARDMGFQPSDCLVIEDSSKGIEAAIRGGFDVFAYAENGREHHFSYQPTETFTTMAELLPLIESYSK